jgi:hypothetical protein
MVAKFVKKMMRAKGRLLRTERLRRKKLRQN